MCACSNGRFHLPNSTWVPIWNSLPVWEWHLHEQNRVSLLNWSIHFLYLLPYLVLKVTCGLQASGWVYYALYSLTMTLSLSEFHLVTCQAATHELQAIQHGISWEIRQPTGKYKTFTKDILFGLLLARLLGCTYQKNCCTLSPSWWTLLTHASQDMIAKQLHRGYLSLTFLQPDIKPAFTSRQSVSYPSAFQYIGH
jgi:hypothetical protein